jgi:FKBP-type peptidyl-prolyl cis-trans isomerase 2
MSTKTTFKRIALVAVAALGFGMLSVIPSNAASPESTVAATTAAPWIVQIAQSDTGTATARTATQIAGASNFVQLKGGATAASALSVLKVTGSTIVAVAGANGTVNVAATEVVYSSAVDANNTVNIATPTAGTVTAIWYTRTVLNGVPTDTEAQKITITVSAVKTWSDRFSTATAAAIGAGTNGIAGTDETILAPKGTLNTAPLHVGSITMSFKDSADAVLSTPTGEFPAVRAVITGPGNIQFTGGSEVALGRDITLVTKAQAPVLKIYNDGTGGKSTIDIYVGGVLWKSKSVSFYGTVTTLTATQGLFVAPTTGGAHGCGSTTAVCTGSTIALSPAATIAATDANGIAVPFLTIGASSSDATVFASSTTSAETVATGTGSYNANVSAIPAGTSGKTAAITFRTLLADGVTYVSATPLTYAIGGSAASVTLDVATTGKAGEKATVTLTKKDSAGNKAADAVHTVAFKSNTSVTSSIFDASSNTQTSGSSSQKVVNGTKTWDFFNPLVEAEVKFDITVDSLLTASASFAVGSTSAAAADLAAEALDAANAATDAANAAAEAADAATAAAQDAADAVAALATQVATYISNLRKQITALTNLVVKIQKKVKA